MKPTPSTSDEEKARLILCLGISDEITYPDARRAMLRVAQGLGEARMEGAAEEMRRNALTICDLRVELEQAKAATVAFFATVQERREDAVEALRNTKDQNSNMAGAYIGQMEALDMVIELLGNPEEDEALAALEETE